MKTHVFLTLAFTIIAAPLSLAQNSNNQSGGSTSEDIAQKIWHANLPGGQYMVALGTISNIGIHEYIANGGARVYEVTVSAGGPALARFYYMEPMTDKSPLNIGQVVADRLKKASDEVGKRTGLGDAWQKVAKDYPNTTHAHTIEFRLDYKDDLDALFASLQRSWLRGKGARFTIKNG